MRLLFSVALIPLCYGFSRTILEIVFRLNVSSEVDSPWMYFVAGFISYLALQAIFFKPVFMYVFGHELTHALAGIISGSKIRAFNVKRDSGSVVLSDVNVFVTLAPYFIPIYTIVLLVAHAIFIIPRGYFLFLLGMTVSFHIALNVFAISQGQSDIRRYGRFFSIVVVYIANCLVSGALLCIFFPVSLTEFMKKSANHSVEGVYLAWGLITTIIQR